MCDKETHTLMKRSTKAWAVLAPVGVQATPGMLLELRNCFCGTTLARQILGGAHRQASVLLGYHADGVLPIEALALLEEHAEEPLECVSIARAIIGGNA